ncbi:hypothetical protein ABFA07_016680 [Porites harrisoni]
MMNRPVMLLVIAVVIAMCAVPSKGIPTATNGTADCAVLCLGCRFGCCCSCWQFAGEDINCRLAPGGCFPTF